MIYLTRCYRLAAAHILTQPALSFEDNLKIFGKCANPGGHGHDYELEISITGPIDEETGQIIDPNLLDEIFHNSVEQEFSYSMLNDKPAFESLVPTAENIARVCYESLAVAVSNRSSARLAHLRVVETPRNFVDLGELL